MITIYSTTTCSYCTRAKQLLDSKGQKYQEILIDTDDAKRDEMLRLSGGRQSVPQIFIHGHHVGGYDDLYALQTKGELDKLLNNKE